MLLVIPSQISVLRVGSLLWYFYHCSLNVAKHGYRSFCYMTMPYTELILPTIVDLDSAQYTAKTSLLFILTTELQTNWRDSGYERFALALKTNCIRQPGRQLPSSSYISLTQSYCIPALISCC